MGNKAKGIVTIDDKYAFRFTTNAMVELEDKLDMSIQQIVHLFETGRLGFKGLRSLVWAGLIHQFDNEDGTYDITEREAGDLIDEYGFDAIVEKLEMAIDYAFGDDDKPKANREMRRKKIEE
jgi:hypothetical protein